MSKNNLHINLVDSSFSEKKTETYDLFVQLSKNELKYTVFDTNENTFIALQAYQFFDVYNDFSLVDPLKNCLDHISLFKEEFRSFNVAFVNNRSTLIPNAIFKEDELQAYHHFNFTVQNEDLFFYDSLINLSAKNVYSIPAFILNEFKKYHRVTFKHFSTSLIDSSILYSKTNQLLNLIDVHVLPSSFQVIVINDGQLELYNSFEYQTSEDFIYYLLFVLDQLNINNEEASIRLLGEVEKKSAIYTILDKYVKTISFGENVVHLNYSNVLKGIAPHMHYTIFNQFL